MRLSEWRIVLHEIPPGNKPSQLAFIGSGGYRKLQRRSEYPNRWRPSQRERTETGSNEASGERRAERHGDEAPVFLHHPIIKARRSSKNRDPAPSFRPASDYCSATAGCLIKCFCIWALKRRTDRAREREKVSESESRFKFKMRLLEPN